MLALIFLLPFALSETDLVYADRMTELQEKNEDVSEQLKETQEQISKLEEEKNQVTDELTSLETDLVTVMASLDSLQEEIDQQKELLAQTEKELKAAEEKEDSQYEAMKKRIQYIYENGGNMGWIEDFLEGKSPEEILNRAEYAEELYDYDKKCMEEYAETVEQVTALQEEQLEEEAVLEEKKTELDDQKDSLEELKKEARDRYDDYDSQMKAAEDKAADYQKVIDEQNEEIRKLVEQQVAISGQTGLISHVEGQGLGVEIANYALQFVGNPYVWGGNSLTEGTDCSGFIHLIYEHFGYNVQRQSALLRSDGVGVSYDQAQPGDIICYDGHVAMYLGNGQIVHASNSAPYPAGGIKVSANAAFTNIITVRRIV